MELRTRFAWLIGAAALVALLAFAGTADAHRISKDKAINKLATYVNAVADELDQDPDYEVIGTDLFPCRRLSAHAVSCRSHIVGYFYGSGLQQQFDCEYEGVAYFPSRRKHRIRIDYDRALDTVKCYDDWAGHTRVSDDWAGHTRVERELRSAVSPVGSVASAQTVAKGDPKDCSDFRTHRQAQRWFKHHHPRRDPAGLDADHDGKACE